MIELKGLSLSYKARPPVEALRNVNLSIRPQEKIALMGPSGCGKSTLLGVLAGLIRPSSGQYLFLGQSVPGYDAAQMAEFRSQRLGVVFQDLRLLGHLSVEDNILLPVDHLEPSEYLGRARQLAKEMAIEQLLKRKPRELSGGQAQRVAIARALLRAPDVLLADEPTANLDEDSANAALLSMLGDASRTCVIATHNPALAEACTRVVRLSQGRIVG